MKTEILKERARVVERFAIAAYCRISVDDELNKENTSIENQKAIIEEFAEQNFPGSALDFYEDRDRSGYTFEQRESYQRLRRKLFKHQYDILIVKDLSRFSRRNGAGLVELEALRDEGVRIIAIGDGIDYPTNDDWLRIQIYFFMNEMPVTDTSKKVRNVIKRRQQDGRWISAVPYGYVMTNTKTMTYTVEPSEAQIVREIFRLYNEGWGYRKIANHLTDRRYPTPRMSERARIEARGDEYHREVKSAWSVATVQGILQNDFYMGTLRQGKTTRKKINGDDVKRDEEDQLIFLNHHEAIIEPTVFAQTQALMKSRSKGNYRGVKKYENAYSGLLRCGDCGAPMFSLSRPDLAPAYLCGTYHKQGKAHCTRHYIRVEVLDSIIREYLRAVKATCEEMIGKLEEEIAEQEENKQQNTDLLEELEERIAAEKESKKIYLRQCAREIARNPKREESIQATYDELIAECESVIEGLENQKRMTFERHETAVKAHEIAPKAVGLFERILEKEKFDKGDLELIVDNITVYETHIHIKLKSDIEGILSSPLFPDDTHADSPDPLSTTAVQHTYRHEDRVFAVNVISDGDPLEIYTATDGEVIFKKYSPVGELSEFAAQYAEVLARISAMPTLVCDRDHVIAASGVSKREYLERRISPVLENYMESRRSYSSHPGSVDDVMPVEGLSLAAAIIYPIIASGDVTGAVVMLKGERVQTPTETELKLAQSAAAFLGKQMEA